jgi:beta-lactamase class A
VQAKELAALKAALEADKDACGVRLGVAAEGLEGLFAGRRVGVNEELVFESASLIKVLILVEVLRQADSGEISLAERIKVKSEDVVDYSEMIHKGSARGTFTVEQLAEGMITVSDNTATNMLIDLVGTKSVNSLSQNLRLANTYLGRKMMDFRSRSAGAHNLTSAADMVILLTAIWRGRLLSANSRRLALAILERQAFNTNIPAALPPDNRVAHKTGELEDMEHDAGIVMLPRKAFALAILTKGSAEARAHAFRRVAASVYETFSDGCGTQRARSS